MNDAVTIAVNGVPRRVSADATIAAVLLGLGEFAFRRDANALARAPLCGMGTCFECRVTIDGVRDERSCLVSVREGMHVETSR